MHLNSVWRAWFWGKSVQDGLVGYDFLLLHSRIFLTYKTKLGRIRPLRASSIPTYLISNNTFSSFMGNCTVVTLLRMANSNTSSWCFLRLFFLITHVGIECCMVIHSSMDCNSLLYGYNLVTNNLQCLFKEKKDEGFYRTLNLHRHQVSKPREGNVLLFLKNTAQSYNQVIKSNAFYFKV